MIDDLECPYCGEGQEVCHDDGAGYAEDESHEMQCSDCDKYFTFQTHISFSYFPEKADCLNDAPHNLTEWRGYYATRGNNIKIVGARLVIM